MVGGSRTVRTRTLNGTIHFAGLEFVGPRVGFMDPTPGKANIGAAVLDGLITTLDQANHLISFSLSEGTLLPAPGPRQRMEGAGLGPGARRTLGLQFRGRGGSFSEIASVATGSLGERSGFEPGDEVLSLNGRPMPEYNQTELRNMISGSEVLRWEIKRDGEQLVIEIG